MGFVNFADVSSAWYTHYNSEGVLDCMLLLYVDDFMISGPQSGVTACWKALREDIEM